MAVQTVYPDNQPAAIVGAQATMIPSTIISRTVEGLTAIGFGVAVAQGDADKGCHAFGSGDTAILGITIVDRSAPGATTSGGYITARTPDKFGVGESARVLTKGDVWVTASVAVDAGDPVYVVPATGAFAKTNASSAVQIANARWDTSAAQGALAVVRIS